LKWRIRRKIERLKEVPVEAFAFMPGGVVEDKNVPFSGRLYRFCCFVQENLEDIRITVACLDGEKLTSTGTDSTYDSKADMISIMNHPGSCSFDCPTPSGFRFPFYPCLIPIPEFYIRIFDKAVQFFEKLLPQGLILSIGPGLRDLQDIPFLMEKTQNGIMRTLNLIFPLNMAVKGCSSPKRPLGTSWILELLYNFLFLLPGDKPLSSCSFLGNQTISSISVEGPDDLFYGALTQIKHLHHLLSGRARKKHDNGEASSIRLLVTGLSNRLKISKRGILSIGSKISPSHEPYICTPLVKCLAFSTVNGTLFCGRV
jgi:hypothetical protein